MGAYVGAFFVFAYIFISKNKWLSLLSAPIIGTISHFSLVYRNQRKVRILRFLARVLSPVINWTHRNQVTVGGISGGILCSV